jgi:hypothetical protein
MSDNLENFLSISEFWLEQYGRLPSREERETYEAIVQQVARETGAPPVIVGDPVQRLPDGHYVFTCTQCGAQQITADLRDVLHPGEHGAWAVPTLATIALCPQCYTPPWQLIFE